MNKIYLVRHGESEGNADKNVYFTKKDWEIGLTDRGRTQAAEAALKIHELTGGSFLNFDLYYSPYLRAKDTASHICSTLHGYEYNHIYKRREDPRLREREWGVLRDLNEEDRNKDDIFNFFYKPQGGESFANAYDRAASFHQWLELNKHSDHVIVVAHGELIKCYLKYLLGWSQDEFTKWRSPYNCEVLEVIRREDNSWFLSSNTPLSVSRFYKGEPEL